MKDKFSSRKFCPYAPYSVAHIGFADRSILPAYEKGMVIRMDEFIKKTCNFNSLCCANCAKIIEREVGELAGVNLSKVDFPLKVLTIDVESTETLLSLAGQIESIARKYDSEIVIQKKEPGKKTIYLLGLDCADCARKIEDAVKKLDGVKTVGVDFTTQRLTIETIDIDDLPAVLRATAETVLSIEPDVKISYVERATENDKKNDLKERLSLAGLISGAVLFAVGLIFSFPAPVEFSLFLAAYLLSGYHVLSVAIRNIAKGRVLDENFLMGIATVGAFAIGEFPEGAAVMLFFRLGELLEHIAVNRSRKSISSLMDIRPDYANLKIDGEVRRVSPEEVGIGDHIIIKPGEKIPLDGKVVEGISSLDTSALTGESLPRDVKAGDDLLSGSVNKSGLLTVSVTKGFGDSTVSKILDLVRNAAGRKAPTESFITKFARYYTPVVVLSALALAVVPPLLLTGASFADWLNRGLVFLVVSCPCALVVSIPLGFFGGIGGASKNGILVKGGNFLEALNHIDTVVFDKTGTLTKGRFKVTEIKAGNGFSREDVLSFAAHAESFSSHPIAVSVREAYGRDIDITHIADYEELSGRGIRLSIDSKTVLAGNEKLMASENIEWHKENAAGTVVYVAVDGVYAGCLVIADEMKPDSAETVRRLKDGGVRKTIMLTGDSKAVGECVGQALSIDEVYCELLPQQKVEEVERLSKKISRGGKLVFVGDGINDAPVLARADVGVAMGALGSDAAIEAADVVLMTDEPSKLADAVDIAKRTRRIVRQNIVFALGIKAVLLTLGAFGIATMWAAVFGDVGVTVIAVLNAARTMHTVKKLQSSNACLK